MSYFQVAVQSPRILYRSYRPFTKVFFSRNNFIVNSNFSQRIFSTTSAASDNIESTSNVKRNSFLSYESNFAANEFKNRWLMVVPAVMAHICIGSPFGWSVMADAITRQNGFVASAATDWTLGEAALPLSFAFICQGIVASSLGTWQMKIGTRKSMAIASVCFGGGMMMGAAGVYLHSLPLLYIGYGVLGGTGMGLSYTPPIQALMEWFPDKKVWYPD